MVLKVLKYNKISNLFNTNYTNKYTIYVKVYKF